MEKFLALLKAVLHEVTFEVREANGMEFKRAENVDSPHRGSGDEHTLPDVSFLDAQMVTLSPGNPNVILRR